MKKLLMTSMCLSVFALSAMEEPSINTIKEAFETKIASWPATENATITHTALTTVGLPWGNDLKQISAHIPWHMHGDYEEFFNKLAAGERPIDHTLLITIYTKMKQGRYCKLSSEQYLQYLLWPEPVRAVASIYVQKETEKKSTCVVQ
ncbi:MAG: hypothetical protein WCE21_03030 [Candidatus Babeliales bacterium]